MNIDPLLEWVKSTPLSQAVSESDWLFPTIESVHVVALTLVVGSIAAVDLKLLNLASRQRSARDLIDAVLPVTWWAFVCAVFTGLLLFSAKPVTYGHNVFFLVKIGLIALAGLNMLAFHKIVHRRLPEGASTGPADPLVRASGLTSLVIWVGVVACGRWIGFSV
jgi:hypothetical protein